MTLTAPERVQLPPIGCAAGAGDCAARSLRESCSACHGRIVRGATRRCPACGGEGAVPAWHPTCALDATVEDPEAPWCSLPLVCA